MRTDWAGASMTIPPISPPYLPTVGALAEILRQGAVAAAGDPEKVAELVLQIVAMNNRPLRLLVGSDAVTYAAAAADARAAADATWRELSISTDHYDVGARALDPLGQERT
jgi:hypothetical protein